MLRYFLPRWALLLAWPESLGGLAVPTCRRRCRGLGHWLGLLGVPCHVLPQVVDRKSTFRGVGCWRGSVSG